MEEPAPRVLRCIKYTITVMISGKETCFVHFGLTLCVVHTLNDMTV